MTLQERAAKGAQLLDERRPDWANFVSVNILEMNYLHTCVLGQLFGNYAAGCNQLSLEPEDGKTAELGFRTNGREDWKLLNSAWKNEIEKRQLTSAS